MPKVADVRALLRLYGVTAEPECELLLRLARESRAPGWWETYTDGVAPERFFLDGPGRYAALEADAVGLRTFDPGILHGLLQTADYARAVLAGQPPHHAAHEIDALGRSLDPDASQEVVRRRAEQARPPRKART